MVLCSP
ncbi:hypothetical protein ECFRIK1999_3364, partial [Escherichia coli FRIK1999]